ncbi:hypothetical protein MIMGU_mgv11b018965mg [Erythranthe guttata]|uniref:Uncharacterized protein n=1 Tax=Erythranthe guttata TaxID=4155 RepID=A0A022RXR0_ERYGU|nr:hypothetical protein MIMGU_mgv11b018965mg [Erythranthe guttata]
MIRQMGLEGFENGFLGRNASLIQICGEVQNASKFSGQNAINRVIYGEKTSRCYIKVVKNNQKVTTTMDSNCITNEIRDAQAGDAGNDGRDEDRISDAATWTFRRGFRGGDPLSVPTEFKKKKYVDDEASFGFFAIDLRLIFLGNTRMRCANEKAYISYVK